MALSIDGTGNGTIGNLSVTTATGNIVSSGDSGTITASMLDGGQSGSAPALAVRAYVNFNGTGTVAIRESVNISSITDNGVGSYTTNYTTAMPNADYTVGFGCRQASSGSDAYGRLSDVMSTSQTKFFIKDLAGTAVDSFTVTATVCV